MSLDKGITQPILADGKISMSPILVLVGPTGVGKTEFSLILAGFLDGEIISTDSRLFYRGMDIGTAKPSICERERIRHHLIDIAEPQESLSLSTFQKLAYGAIQEVQSRGKMPILVGGSGQYIRAITQGWTPPEVPPDLLLRAELEKQVERTGYKQLHNELQSLDPEAAQKIDPRNVRRTIRALEVIYISGIKFSEQRGRSDKQNNSIVIGLTRPRPELYRRVDLRIEQMFADGLMDEVRRLLESGVSPLLPAMSSIGYRECVSVVHGDLTLDDAKTAMRRATRILIRRQSNWFKIDDISISWFDLAILPQAEIISKIMALV